MRILGFSDLHRDIEATRAILTSSRSADVLVGAGDFGTQGLGSLDTLQILRECKVPVVVVHGNHDLPSEVSAFCSSVTNFHYLHGSSVTIDGIEFFGVGGEVPSRTNASWNASDSEELVKGMFVQSPTGGVLVTHTPPHGIADVQNDGSHEGSEAIFDGILDSQPKLNLCGHIHSAWGTTGSLGRTRIHNLGPTINWFEI